MKTTTASAGLLIATLFLAGCNGTLDDIAPSSAEVKAHVQLPQKIRDTMRDKGMTTTAPIMVRIFKEESVLEVWKQKDNGRYDLVTSYDICKWSGRLGPKFTEGDRQAPEGFYTVRPHQMNPQSQYHLAFNIGFPNTYDRVNNRTGTHLMVHGACSSAGCYSMSDVQIEQIYAFARDAFKGGQEGFQIQAFPFRMTAANMARYKDDPNFGFWTMLKEGYDHFEITKVPPKVDVCGKRYVFNATAEAGKTLQAAADCPALTYPDTLMAAYKSYQATYRNAFEAATGKTSKVALSPSIAGVQEAALVADWSRRRSRGERVTREPPTLDRPEILMAEQKPAAPPAIIAIPETVATVPTPADTARAETVIAEAPGQVQAEITPTAEKPSLRSRVLGMFGGS